MRYTFAKLRWTWRARQSRTPRELALPGTKLTTQYLHPALEEAALRVGGGELEGPPVVRESIRWAAGAAEQVGAGGVREVVLPQLRVEVEGVEEGEASIRALGKGHGDRSVEVDDGRRGDLAEVGVEGDGAGGVRRRGRRDGRVLDGGPGLQQGGAGRGAEVMEGVLSCGAGLTLDLGHHRARTARRCRPVTGDYQDSGHEGPPGLHRMTVG